MDKFLEDAKQLIKKRNEEWREKELCKKPVIENLLEKVASGEFTQQDAIQALEQDKAYKDEIRNGKKRYYLARVKPEYQKEYYAFINNPKGCYDPNWENTIIGIEHPITEEKVAIRSLGYFQGYMTFFFCVYAKTEYFEIIDEEETNEAL